MATQTNNYKLTKPDADDYYDIAVQNGNMDIIDATMDGLITREECTSFLKMKDGTYTGNGVASTRDVTLHIAPKALIILQNSVPLGMASAQNSMTAENVVKLSVTPSGFSLGGGFANENGVSYGYVIFY